MNGASLLWKGSFSPPIWAIASDKVQVMLGKNASHLLV